MLQGVVELAHGMHESGEDAMCCRQRAERLANRATALVPTLQELERVVSTSMIGEPLSTVKSLSVTMVLVAKVRNATHHGWTPGRLTLAGFPEVQLPSRVVRLMSRGTMPRGSGTLQCWTAVNGGTWPTAVQGEANRLLLRPSAQH
jgi:hypothetical protein